MYEAVLLMLLRGVEAQTATAVLKRFGPDRTFEATVQHPDSVVEAAVSAGLQTQIATNPCLTPAQVVFLLKAGVPVQSLFGSAESVGGTTDRALELLQENPALAYSARSDDTTVADLLHGPPATPLTFTKARPAVTWALSVGAITARSLLEDTRPALLAVQLLAGAARESAFPVSERQIADLLCHLLSGTVGRDPAAWEALVHNLSTFPGTLPELLRQATAAKATPEVLCAPAKIRPAVSRLLERLTPDDFAALLPYLDEALTDGALPGGVAPVPQMVELTLTTRNPILLRNLASHRHVGRETAERLHRLDDPQVNLRLAANQPGVGAALRREILAGNSPTGGPRLPMTQELRDEVKVLTADTDQRAMALSGDPELVAHVFTHRLKLRRVDQLDCLITLWERSGEQTLLPVLKTCTDDFGPAVYKIAVQALDSGNLQTLITERDRLAAQSAARRKTEPTPVENWRLPAPERIRADPLDDYHHHWIVDALTTGALTQDDLVRHGHPARHVADALVRRAVYEETPAPVLPAVTAALGTDPATWTVFAQLLPDFTGTLPELAELAASATH
jgi:hypothetical protein